MWLVVLLLGGVSGMQCPVLKCQQEIAMNCVNVSEGIVVASKCPVGYTCPAQSLDQFLPQNCTQAGKSPAIAVCPEPMSIGEPCNSTLPCESGAYCDSELLTCMKWKRMGQRCQTTKQCRFGTVCSLRRCVEMWSLEGSQAATNALACYSGRLYAEKCIEESVTLGAIPKQCSRDSDCDSSTGLPGKCACGLNRQGTAYCRPHQSDLIVKEFRTAAREERLELAHALALRVIRYAEIAGSDTCGAELLSTSVAIGELMAQTCQGLLLLLHSLPFLVV